MKKPATDVNDTYLNKKHVSHYKRRSYFKQSIAMLFLAIFGFSVITIALPPFTPKVSADVVQDTQRTSLQYAMNQCVDRGLGSPRNDASSPFLKNNDKVTVGYTVNGNDTGEMTCQNVFTAYKATTASSDQDIMKALGYTYGPLVGQSGSTSQWAYRLNAGTSKSALAAYGASKGIGPLTDAMRYRLANDALFSPQGCGANPNNLKPAGTDPDVGASADIIVVNADGSTSRYSVQDNKRLYINDVYPDNGGHQYCLDLKKAMVNYAPAFTTAAKTDVYSSDSFYSQLCPLTGAGGGAESLRQECIEKVKKAVQDCYAVNNIGPGDIGGDVSEDEFADCIAARSGLSVDQIKAAMNATKVALNPVTAGQTKPDPCAILPTETTWRWLACSLLTILSTITNSLYSTIQGLMYTPIEKYFENGSFNNSINLFRIIGIGIIIISGIVMVIAEASGLGFVDAYTIRKLLPKLGIAILGVAMSAPLTKFAVDLSNDIGLGAGGLIEAATPSAPVGDPSSLGYAISGTFIIGAALAGALAINAWSTLMMIPLVIIAFLVGAIILSMRQMVVLVCILIAPLAIASSVLPGTDKLWKFWKSTFITMLMMFPIIMIILKSGEFMSGVIAGSQTGVIATLLVVLTFIGPYLLLVKIFQMTSGVLGGLISMGQKASNMGMLGSARKWASERDQRVMKRRTGRADRYLTERRVEAQRALKGSIDSRSGIGRTAIGRMAARGLANRLDDMDGNIEAKWSAMQAQEAKVMNDQIATGVDDEPRALTVNKFAADKDALDGTMINKTDWTLSENGLRRVKKGENGQVMTEYRTLGGAWAREASVDRAYQRWGSNANAKQAALSYEMRKSNSDEDVEGILTRYQNLSQGAGGWNMSTEMASSAWIGAAYENQNQHLEFKRYNAWENSSGKLKDSSYDSFVAEVFQKKGNYPLSQMHAQTIKQLTNAHDSATRRLKANPSDENAKTTIKQLESIAELFAHDAGYSAGSQLIPGDGDKDPVTVSRPPEAQGPVMSGSRERMVNASGAGAVGDAAFEFVARTGVLDRPPETPQKRRRTDSESRP